MSVALAQVFEQCQGTVVQQRLPLKLTFAEVA
jgi:hypothetical protein